MDPLTIINIWLLALLAMIAACGFELVVLRETVDEMSQRLERVEDAVLVLREKTSPSEMDAIKTRWERIHRNARCGRP